MPCRNCATFFLPDTDVRVKRPGYVGRLNEMLYKAVRQEAQAKKKVLVLGGDHSIAIGSIAGLKLCYKK